MKGVRALKRCVVNAAKAPGSDGHGEDAGRRGDAPGKIVFEMEKRRLPCRRKTTIKDFSARATARRQDCVNWPETAAVKPSLLKLMPGQLQVDSGRIHVGTKPEVAYFDQHRAELIRKTAMDNLAEGKR